MSATGNMLEQKDDEIIRLRRQLQEYQRTVNMIDDFFEYASESVSDRKFIHAKLDALTVSLKILK